MATLLPQPSEGWGYRHVVSHLERLVFSINVMPLRVTALLSFFQIYLIVVDCMNTSLFIIYPLKGRLGCVLWFGPKLLLKKLTVYRDGVSGRWMDPEDAVSGWVCNLTALLGCDRNLGVGPSWREWVLGTLSYGLYLAPCPSLSGAFSASWLLRGEQVLLHTPATMMSASLQSCSHGDSQARAKTFETEAEINLASFTLFFSSILTLTMNS